MVTAIQDPKETEQQFLLRLLDARNRVFFTSKEERVEAEYSTQLVEKSFSGLCWVNELAYFNFTIKYRSGRVTTDADSLSRIPDFESYSQTCTEEMSPQTTNAMIYAVNLLAKGKSNWATPCTMDPNVLAIDSSNFRNDLRIGVNDLLNGQLNDPVTSRVIQFIEQGKKPLPKDLLHESSDVKFNSRLA